MFKPQILWAALIVATVTGCDKPAPPTSQARPVRTVTVERVAEGETVSLTGHIRAKDQGNLPFPLHGRVIERPVNVGDVRIASPEMFPEAEMLPHLICSRPMFIGGAKDEAD